MRKAQRHSRMRTFLPWVLLVELAITIPCSGYLLPSRNIHSRRAPLLGSFVNGKQTVTKSQSVRKGECELFSSQSSEDAPEKYLSQEQVKELLSGGFMKGQPSYPAWKSKRRRQKLYEMTEWATSDEANRPIICEYEPDAGWLWTRWTGTVLAMTYIPVLFNISVGILINWYVHSHTAANWSFFSVPPADDPIILRLEGLKTLWEYQLTLCTFILAFFTSQAYSYWRSVYFTTRAIQGRINDICLIITTNAERKKRITPDGKEMSDYSDRAKELVATCTRLIRVSHTL